MPRIPLYRNVQAREMLELLLVSAVSSLLAVRFYLHLTGYPRLGGGGLHVAHMLWGGLLMLAGLVLALSFIGARARWLTALAGGAGFGIFIDEIGKFITQDNNYFFRPAVGIIYAIFVILYLAFTFLSRDRQLTSREYLINALSQLEEAVAADMDAAEKERALALLARADQRSGITRGLRRIVEATPVAEARRAGWLERLALRLDDAYHWFWRRRRSERLVQAVFVAETVALFAGVALTAYGSLDDLRAVLAGHTSYGNVLLAGQLAAAAVASGFAIDGALHLAGDRLRAIGRFRQATLVNLLLTEIFVFLREEFAAMPGFAVNLALLVLLSYAVRQERRLRMGA